MEEWARKLKQSGYQASVRLQVVSEALRKYQKMCKSEPLRRKGFDRTDCLCCEKGKPGMWETNSVGYRIKCVGCQGAGKWAFYEDDTGQNAYTRGLKHQEDLKKQKKMIVRCGNIAF